MSLSFNGVAKRKPLQCIIPNSIDAICDMSKFNNATVMFRCYDRNGDLWEMMAPRYGREI